MKKKEFAVSKSALAKILANLSGLVAHRQENGINYIKVLLYPTYCQEKINELGLIAIKTK